MLKKIISILAVAVLSVTVSANVYAATITVEKGDTLWALSRANHLSVENLQKLNNLTTDLIHPGDVLTVAPEKRYTVIKGDTLWDIAMNHQVTVSQIMEWNQLYSDLIHPGLNLVIFEGLKNNTISLSENPVQHVAEAPTESAPAPAVEAPAPTESTPAPAVEAPAPVESAPAVEAAAPSSKEIIVEATAYTASCEGCSGITATGIDLLANPNQKVISVDPSVIPLGSKVYVEGYGEAIAGDTGGAIKGNKIDIFIPTKQEAINFGRKQVKVTILN
ncbi:3D domain-containing protein [Neobacillus niacini]|uniref:3D domain-containing protein n=1 Tax=Neobacillus niacini TaxID=86668 RepID=UPI00203B6178|nr:LysM peptidoglycan-binding and 3D domain-containing protein [Neobacillus niacini]MCM3694687.1 LysM peptidoglycan-binding domain-containing protein [Neobacillus niacini]